MKLLVVNWLDRENPHAGGAEVHLHETFGRAADHGHDVTLLCSGWPGCAPMTELDGIRVFRSGGRLSFGLRAWPFYRRRLVGEGFDLVLEDLNKAPVFTPFWGGAPTALLVHHLFGRTAFQEASLPMATATWLLERPIPLVYRSVPTMAVSESTAGDLAVRGLDRSRIRVIPNGVDADTLTPAPDGKRFSEPTLLYLGRLKRYKRVDLILRGVDELRSRGVRCRLVVAGEGDHRSELEALADELRLRDRAVFEGFVPEERKLELLRRSWVHLLTSPKEGWGIANLEAAACGTPTVASDSPGLRESVRDGETGYLVPHGDVNGLADRVQRLLERDDLRERMGSAARSFARGFSWDATARNTMEFLEEVADDDRPS